MLSRITRPVALIGTVTVLLLTFAAGSASAASAPTIVPEVTNAGATGPTVVGIGDSILEGHGLDADQAWLAVIAKEKGWRLTNLASDGSGFVTVGDDNDTFSDQVTAAKSLHPDIVVLSGSSNDLGESASAIQTATISTIAELRADLPNVQIIAVSAVWGDTTLPAQMNAIDADVAAATIAAGGTSLPIGQPLSGHPTLMQSDDVHPTAEGQHVIAAAVDRAIASAHLNLRSPEPPLT